MVKFAIGQDSHRFEAVNSGKQLVLGGLTISGCEGLSGNSDADVLLHAITNAISGISGENILGAVSDKLCLEQGITDSSVYLKKAIQTLGKYRITHISASIECKKPLLAKHIPAIKEKIAALCNVKSNDVGITATSGEGLTAFGRGEGIQVFAAVTAEC